MNAHVPRQLSGTAIIHAEEILRLPGETVKLARLLWPAIPWPRASPDAAPGRGEFSAEP
jgi:hypothetical protein